MLSEYLLGRLISLYSNTVIVQFCAMLLYTHCLRQSNLTAVLHTLVTSKLYNCKYILSKLPSKIVWKFNYGRMQQLAYLWGWLIFMYIYSEISVVTANSSEPHSPEPWTPNIEIDRLKKLDPKLFNRSLFSCILLSFVFQTCSGFIPLQIPLSG